jgi:hypothetical protein
MASPAPLASLELPSSFVAFPGAVPAAPRPPPPTAVVAGACFALDRRGLQAEGSVPAAVIAAHRANLRFLANKEVENLSPRLHSLTTPVFDYCLLEQGQIRSLSFLSAFTHAPPSEFRLPMGTQQMLVSVGGQVRRFAVETSSSVRRGLAGRWTGASACAPELGFRATPSGCTDLMPTFVARVVQLLSLTAPDRAGVDQLAVLLAAIEQVSRQASAVDPIELTARVGKAPGAPDLAALPPASIEHGRSLTYVETSDMNGEGANLVAVRLAVDGAVGTIQTELLVGLSSTMIPGIPTGL